jgi:putative salt-induced outer membrane protein
LNPWLLGYVGADFQTDALQTLDLRSVFGGGLGLHVIKNDRTTLALLGGANYTREKYAALPSRSFAAASAGEELTHKPAKSTLITQKLYFFPELSESGE